MCFFLGYQLAISHQRHCSIVNLLRREILNLSLSGENNSANMPNRRVKLLNARLGRRAGCRRLRRKGTATGSSDRKKQSLNHGFLAHRIV